MHHYNFGNSEFSSGKFKWGFCLRLQIQKYEQLHYKLKKLVEIFISVWNLPLKILH